LVEEQGRLELANALARALMNKGLAHAVQGKLEEAVACNQQALATLRRLVKEDVPLYTLGRLEEANNLVKTLMNQGKALQALGRREEVMACYEEALDTLRRLIK